MRVFVWVCAGKCSAAAEAWPGYYTPWNWSSVGGELPDMGTGKWNWVSCKSSIITLNHLSSPQPFTNIFL